MIDIKKIYKNLPKDDTLLNDVTYALLINEDNELLVAINIDGYMKYLTADGKISSSLTSCYEDTIQEFNDNKEYQIIQLLTKAEALKLAKYLQSAKFDTGEYGAVLGIKDNQLVYIFGCGDSIIPVQDVLNYLQVSKQILVMKNLKANEGYIKVLNELEDNDTKVTDSKIIELCKKFKIK